MLYVLLQRQMKKKYIAVFLQNIKYLQQCTSSAEFLIPASPLLLFYGVSKIQT